MTEQWLPIRDFDGYEVSDRGRVRSWRLWGAHVGKKRKTPLVMKPQITTNGYVRVDLCFGSGYKHKLIHRLVLEAFADARPDGHECAHRDGNRLNNNLSNLHWVLHTNNELDKLRHGTLIKGEEHWKAKLTERDVQEIRQVSNSSYAVAAEFGVSPGHVRSIRQRKSWSHVA